MTVKALVVPVDGPSEVREIETDLQTIKGIVGGWLEAIQPRHDQYGIWHAYVDEEGKLKGLPVNMRATHLAHEAGWPQGDLLCGPVVFLGSAGEGEDAGAEEGDVPRTLAMLADDLGV